MSLPSGLPTAVFSLSEGPLFFCAHQPVFFVGCVKKKSFVVRNRPFGAKGDFGGSRGGVKCASRIALFFAFEYPQNFFSFLRTKLEVPPGFFKILKLKKIWDFPLFFEKNNFFDKNLILGVLPKIKILGYSKVKKTVILEVHLVCQK